MTKVLMIGLITDTHYKQYDLFSLVSFHNEQARKPTVGILTFSSHLKGQLLMHDMFSQHLLSFWITGKPFSGPLIH